MMVIRFLKMIWSIVLFVCCLVPIAFAIVLGNANFLWVLLIFIPAAVLLLLRQKNEPFDSRAVFYLFDNKKEKKEIERLRAMLSPEQNNLEELNKKIDSAKEELASIERQTNDILQKSAKEKEMLDESVNAKAEELRGLRAQIVETREEILVQNCGLYHPKFDFMNSDEYKIRLMGIRAEQKELIKANAAVSGVDNWSVNGSEAKGKKMVADTQKLLLRAFNAECDTVVDKVKYNNIEAAEKKITASKDAISKLGAMMNISITPAYYRLKITELYLAYEYQRKKQEEKEEQKEARARLREEAKLAKEIEAQREKLEKEENHYQNALKNISEQLENASENEKEAIEAKKKQIESRLEEIGKLNIEMDYRLANQRAGYVYVISNIGAFGENVYKIGMTRRLHPEERVDELGDASVPFNFDVHAMIFSEDAPKLEAALHNAFADKKLNCINQRREFFNVTLDEIKKVVKENFDKSVDFIDIAPAEQYRESLAMRKNMQIV